VVTLDGICGDPHYTSCTDPMKLFLKMGSECSSWLGRGMRLGESGLSDFLRGHESKTV